MRDHGDEHIAAPAPAPSELDRLRADLATYRALVSPDMLAAIAANREAFGHIAALLATGRPGAGSGPDGQTVEQHVAALRRHAEHVATGYDDGPAWVTVLVDDRDSGRPHAAHAAARAILAITRAGEE